MTKDSKEFHNFNEGKEYYIIKNSKLAKKYKTLIIILVMSIIGNVVLFTGWVKKEKTINKYFLTMVDETQMNIAEAYWNMGYVKISGNSQQVIKYLITTGNHLEGANKYVQHYSIYYTYKSKNNKSYGGNLTATRFFNVYTSILRDWIKAVQDGNNDETPTKEDILNFRKDLNNIAKKFSGFLMGEENQPFKDYSNQSSIENLTKEELDNLFLLLSKEAKTEQAIQAFKRLSF